MHLSPSVVVVVVSRATKQHRYKDDTRRGRGRAERINEQRPFIRNSASAEPGSAPFVLLLGPAKKAAGGPTAFDIPRDLLIRGKPSAANAITAAPVVEHKLLAGPRCGRLRKPRTDRRRSAELRPLCRRAESARSLLLRLASPEHIHSLGPARIIGGNELITNSLGFPRVLLRPEFERQVLSVLFVLFSSGGNNGNGVFPDKERAVLEG